MCEHKIEIKVAPDVVTTHCTSCGKIIDVKERQVLIPGYPVYPVYPTYPIYPDFSPPQPWYYTSCESFNAG